MLGRKVASKTTQARVRELAEVYAAKHGCTVDDVFGRSRVANVVAARHAVMTDAWQEGWAYAEIARAFEVDHTSVMHGVDKILVERANAERRSVA